MPGGVGDEDLAVADGPFSGLGGDPATLGVGSGRRLQLSTERRATPGQNEGSSEKFSH